MMKNIQLFEAWKNDDDADQDITNKEELEILLTEMKDELDYFSYEIVVCDHIKESYNIKYFMNNSIGFSTNDYENCKEAIKVSMRNLENLNKFINLSYNLIERLDNMGYDIAYFSNNNTHHRNDEVIRSEIRISRK